LKKKLKPKAAAAPARKKIQPSKPIVKVVKSPVSSVIIRELIETANANDAKIKHEDFMDFLSENNLLEHKKEITTHLLSLNIKILRKMTGFKSGKTYRI
jgi:G:T/U-mismatch repair DNA glycosylase